MKYCLPVILFLVLVQPGAAQGSRADVPFHSFDHLSAEDGLAGGAVQAMVEDRHGLCGLEHSKG